MIETIEIQYPSAVTLKKYGLTLDEWIVILHSQDDVCPICGKFPSTGRFVTDHQHVKGYRTLPPEVRKTYVRGITCWFCNRYYMSKGMTIEKAQNIATYLAKYGGKSAATP